MFQVRLIIVLFLSAFIFDVGAQIAKENNSRPEVIQTSKDSDTKTPADFKGNLCVPEYSSGCGMGDGFTDFAVEEIQNYGSGCADNMGYDGWSQYLELGPAFLLPGNTYDFIMQTGYDDQYVTIWIDFNDDLTLTEDEKIISDFILVESGQFYTASITMPTGVIMGQHIMRSRARWQSSCTDPCDEYSYGEAEDYYVMVGEAVYGILEGTVTELASGDPVEGATITLEGMFSYSITTGSDGTYYKDYILVGDYDVECFKESYNVINTTITIEEDVLLIQDFQLNQPDIAVYPLSLDVELDQNAIYEETITIENNGNGPMDWSASMQIMNGESKDFLDLQFEYSVAGGNGEAGIESDGQYIYTTKWNGNQFFQYELDGTYIGSFTISGVATIRDMAYDGTYFYGGTASPTIYEMDFETHTLVSVITAPTDVRALAYNDNEDVFYGNNWDSPVLKFDKAGNNVGGFIIGPVGGSYYGFAYDQATVGGPYLWGYAQIGATQNEIIQMQLPSGTETGLTLDVADKLSGQIWGNAGGLFTHPNLVYGKWTLGGVVQNERIWGLELTDAQTWLGVTPNGGTLAGGESEELTVLFDATGLDGGVYEAEIHFTTWPNVGTPIVDVTMLVMSSLYYPCNLLSNVNCTDVELHWEMCPAGAPDPESYNVYRDDEIIANITDTTYTDSLLDPEITYEYKVSAIIDGSETTATPIEELTIPLPDDLEPTNLSFTINGNMITLTWDPPTGCLIPDWYNIYRDGNLIGSTNETYYLFDFGNYEYFVTAVYYFGESGPSNSIVITEINENISNQIFIFPNPAKEKLFIHFPININRLEFLNNLGITIFTKNVYSKTYQLNVSHFNPGIYFIKLYTEQGLVLRKVLIE